MPDPPFEQSAGTLAVRPFSLGDLASQLWLAASHDLISPMVAADYLRTFIVLTESGDQEELRNAVGRALNLLHDARVRREREVRFMGALQEHVADRGGA